MLATHRCNTRVIVIFDMIGKHLLCISARSVSALACPSSGLSLSTTVSCVALAAAAAAAISLRYFFHFTYAILPACVLPVMNRELVFWLSPISRQHCICVLPLLLRYAVGI